jgi:hypothetical protein
LTTSRPQRPSRLVSQTTMADPKTDKEKEEEEERKRDKFNKFL